MLHAPAAHSWATRAPCTRRRVCSLPAPAQGRASKCPESCYKRSETLAKAVPSLGCSARPRITSGPQKRTFGGGLFFATRRVRPLTSACVASATTNSGRLNLGGGLTLEARKTSLLTSPGQRPLGGGVGGGGKESSGEVEEG